MPPFANSNQAHTFLDKTYEDLEQMETPNQLIATQKLELETVLPQSDLLQVDNSLPTFIYNYYNLDPLWHDGETGNRILLIDPDFFKSYPISNKCSEFMLALSKKIPSLQVHVDSFDSLLKEYHFKNIYYKEHPLNIGYVGIEEPRDWITEQIIGYYPSFFLYWKKVEMQLSLKYN